MGALKAVEISQCDCWVGSPLMMPNSLFNSKGMYKLEGTRN